jgi:hypothetical protein
MCLLNARALTAPLVAIFSGENIDESITSTSESLFVRFASDKSVIYRGFNATFALIDQSKLLSPSLSLSLNLTSLGSHRA